MKKLVIASNDYNLTQILLDNLHGVYFEGTATNLDKLLEISLKTKPDIIVCSSFLPGNNLLETIFKVLTNTNARFIILASSPKESTLKDLFLLGIRDFLFDPIQINRLIYRIENPATFAEALEAVPITERNLFFNLSINKLKLSKFLKNQKPDSKDETKLSDEAKEILNGITKLLGVYTEDISIEDQLFLLEQKILDHSSQLKK